MDKQDAEITINPSESLRGNIWVGVKGKSSFGDTSVSGIASGYPTTIQSTFGGDGSDGNLLISSGTVSLDLGGASLFVKNYKIIKITGTGKLTFTNAHSSGTVIILKSLGNVMLTSTTTPCIDASGTGGNGATGKVAAGVAIVGNAASSSTKYFLVTGGGKVGADYNIAGAGGDSVANSFLDITKNIQQSYNGIYVGAGGASGSANTAPSGGTGTSGAGGKGGGGLLIECNRKLNFTGTIWAKGNNGSQGLNLPNALDGLAGGAGGGGGYVLITYNRLISNSGTVSVAGGSGATKLGNFAVAGNGGGGSSEVGGAGNTNGTGGTGALGFSLITSI